MHNSVYEKIEKDIKKTDYYMRESFLLDILYFVLLFALASDIWLIVIFKNIGWIVFAVIIVLCIIIWYIVNFKIIYEISRSFNSQDLLLLEAINVSDFFKIKKVFALMRKLKKTKPVIVDIIKKYGITTKEGLEEAINHYRFKAINTRQLRLDILAILALMTSIIGYFLNNFNLPQNKVVIIYLVSIIVIFLIYIFIISVFKSFFAQYGKKAFYFRIENALSEIRALNKLTAPGRKSKIVREKE